MATDDRCAVYLAHDVNGAILYVGISRRPASRWGQHEERRPDLAQIVSHIEIRWFETRMAAEAEERQLIERLRPPFNRRNGLRPRPDPPARAPVVPRRPADLQYPFPRRIPQCEVCHQERAYSFSWFADRSNWYDPDAGVWKFTGDCTADSEQYYILFRHPHGRGFFDSRAEQDDWVRHMHGKVWFDPGDFGEMLDRFYRTAS